jgi:hypothetical protein
VKFPYRKEYEAKRKAIPRVRIKIAIQNAINRAKKNGMSYDLGILKMADSPPSTCKCCGIEFDYRTMRGLGRNRERSPSIDRVDNSKGYVLGNVLFICMRCNSIKTDASLVELESIVEYIKKNSG